MKSFPVTQSLFSLHIPGPGGTLALLLLFVLVSCQKEPNGIVSDKSAAPKQAAPRSAEMEQNVVQHIQWTINNVIPLIADEEVYAAIAAGNTGSALVTSKLASLGFSSFEHFTQAYYANGNVVFSAINSGELNTASIQQIVGTHTFDWSALGDDVGMAAVLPCYRALQSTLAFTPVVVAAASIGGLWAGLAAGLLHVGIAYIDFKLCMDAHYPNG